MFTNDDLGNPPGTITLVLWLANGIQSAPPGTPAITPVGTMTMQADGSFVFQNTDLPAGSTVLYNYRLSNSAGTSTGLVGIHGA